MTSEFSVHFSQSVLDEFCLSVTPEPGGTTPDPDCEDLEPVIVEYEVSDSGLLAPYLSSALDAGEQDGTDPDEGEAPGKACLNSGTGDNEDVWIVTLSVPDDPLEGDLESTINVNVTAIGACSLLPAPLVND